MTTRTLLRPVAVAGLVAGALLAVPTSADAATSSSLSVRAAIAGETTTAHGRVPRAAKPRPVSLQRYSAQRWITVKTARTTAAGSYSVKLVEPGTTTKYRVVAAKVGRAARVTTPTRTVKPLTQKVSASIPAASPSRDVLTVPTAFSPARPGRPVAIERLVDGRWLQTARGKQSSTGRATLASTTPSRGTYRFRVTAEAWKGAKAVSSASRDVVLDAPEVVDRFSGALNEEPADHATSDASGRHVTFVTTSRTTGHANPGGTYQLYVRDMETDEITLVSHRRGSSLASSGNAMFPEMSSDGRWVVFQSDGDDLVADDSNQRTDTFVWDRESGEVQLLSSTATGRTGQGESTWPSVSPNGRYAAWQTSAPEVTGDPDGHMQIVVLDRFTGRRVIASHRTDGTVGDGTSWRVTATDGGDVAFVSAADLSSTDTNGRADVYLYDQANDRARAVTSAEPGGSQTYDVDAAGRTIVFGTEGSKPVNKLWRSSTARSEVVPGNVGARISDDGAVVAYDLATKVYAYDVTAKRSTLVSRPHPGATSRQSADLRSISGDGRFVFFSATGSDYVGADANGAYHQVRGFVRW